VLISSSVIILTVENIPLNFFDDPIFSFRQLSPSFHQIIGQRKKSRLDGASPITGDLIEVPSSILHPVLVEEGQRKIVYTKIRGAVSGVKT
jgi:hypothetical protein